MFNTKKKTEPKMVQKKNMRMNQLVYVLKVMSDSDVIKKKLETRLY